MLNLDQSNEFRRFSQLDIFFGMPANVTIIGTFVPFQDEVALYHTHFGILDGLIPNKGALSTGVTQGKTSIKEGIAKVMGLVCGKTKVFAMKTGNTVLEAAVNVTENEILHKKEADILSFVINTNAAITPFLANVLFTPYGITAATLATQLTNANSYNSLIGAAGVVITTDMIANKNINAAIKVLQTDLKTLGVDFLRASFLLDLLLITYDSCLSLTTLLKRLFAFYAVIKVAIIHFAALYKEATATVGTITSRTCTGATAQRT